MIYQEIYQIFKKIIQLNEELSLDYQNDKNKFKLLLFL